MKNMIPRITIVIKPLLQCIKYRKILKSRIISFFDNRRATDDLPDYDIPKEQFHKKINKRKNQYSIQIPSSFNRNFIKPFCTFMSSRHHRRKDFFEHNATAWDKLCKHDEVKLEEIFEILPLKKRRSCP